MFTDSQPRIIQASQKNLIAAKSFRPGKMVFEVERDVPGEFVLFQNYHHNWKLKIDDEAAELNRANISFMHAYIPAGRHVLTFCYSTRSLTIACIISPLCILLSILFLVIKNKRK